MAFPFQRHFVATALLTALALPALAQPAPATAPAAQPAASAKAAEGRHAHHHVEPPVAFEHQAGFAARHGGSNSSRLRAWAVLRAIKGVACGLMTTKSASQPGCRLPTTPAKPKACAAPAVCCHHRWLGANDNPSLSRPSRPTK